MTQSNEEAASLIMARGPQRLEAFAQTLATGVPPVQAAKLAGYPQGWTITALEIPLSVHNHGYSATREQAMKDFKARWTATIN
jgi:hypothetical protein